MDIDINLLKETERLHYDDPTCGVLIDAFRNGSHGRSGHCRKRRMVLS